jgi:hypothetical protein
MPFKRSPFGAVVSFECHLKTECHFVMRESVSERAGSKWWSLPVFLERQLHPSHLFLLDHPEVGKNNNKYQQQISSLFGGYFISWGRHYLVTVCFLTTNAICFQTLPVAVPLLIPYLSP